ncbi:TetR/AcrR family transcriptional regulator [Winogradskya consettensis]|uniref:TetR family transcriptional regulator n=1 Tax=Winogradskya consettensis TaxID=113560 RepID=A0A919SBN1_9ACTN|nr:TetR/AcrR family transcriptional regulator [Actinoplanes consettensis]GIM68842.1 TetR family transcriptional regulator [Actinoplanes consettensis]
MTNTPATRGRNQRGRGNLLRDDIVSATLRLLDEAAEDETLSLRAVARELGIATTSIYLHFPDRDALVLAALRSCHDDLMAAVERAEKSAGDPAEGLRERTLVLAGWAERHPGLYKVLHESALNRRADMSFKLVMAERSVAAVQRCIDAGLVAADEDAEVIALDLRAAVHGAVSLRLNEPGSSGSPVDRQIDRFLVKIVGIGF